ncbi:MAG: C4-type zinc ribbon domain-containing protein [Dehalococcoidales bacterium]
MSSVSVLYQLQETELEIESLRETLRAYIKKLEENEALNSERSALSLLRNQLETLRKKQQEIQWLIDDIEAKIKKSNNDLYNGNIKNPKELLNLQQEVGVLESQRKQHEDELLIVLSQTEAVTEAEVQKAENVKKMETEWRSEQSSLIAEAQKLKTAITEMKSKRDTMVSAIDLQMLERYNQLKEKRGVAVAKIEQGTCCGCRITLSTAQLQQVRTGKVVQCDSCRRILYLL